MMDRSGTRWRDRRTRRVVVLLWALILAALVLRALLGEADSGLDTVWGLTFAAWAVPWAVLRRMTLGVTERPADELDERELELRSRFVSLGYYVALLGGSLVVLYLIAAAHVVPDGTMRGAQLLLALLGAAAALPTVAYAWVAEDEPEDETVG